MGGDKRLNKKLAILSGFVLLVLALAPTTYSYVKEKIYYKNHFVAITTFAEITVLDKFIEDEKYYLKFTVDNEYYIDKLKMVDNVRIYQFENKALYDQVDINRSDEYIGLTIKSEIEKKSVYIVRTKHLVSHKLGIFVKIKGKKCIKEI